MVAIRRLTRRDLMDYKRLRDAVLATFPEAFASDAETEALRPPESYLPRLGAEGAGGLPFTLGAFDGDRLAGAVTCERDARVKVRHVATVRGVMVDSEHQRRGIGAMLLDACLAEARAAGDVALLTLSVSSENAPALRLYRSRGFVAYGELPDAIRVGGRSLAKTFLVLRL